MNFVKTYIGSYKLTTFSIPPSLDFPAEGDGGDGGFCCFSCGRSTGLEPYVVVTRMWWHNGFNNVEALDAVASLQVCMDCVYRSAGAEIDWWYIPNVLDTELYGFYNFARQLAAVSARKLSETVVDKDSLNIVSRLANPPLIPILNQLLISGGLYKSDPLILIGRDQCYNCYSHINEQRSSYMELEIAVDVPTPTGQAVYNAHVVAAYCDPCLRALFPIEGNRLL